VNKILIIVAMLLSSSAFAEDCRKITDLRGMTTGYICNQEGEDDQRVTDLNGNTKSYIENGSIKDLRGMTKGYIE